MKRRIRMLAGTMTALFGIAVVLFLIGGEAFLRANSDDGERTADAIVVLAGASGEDNLRVLEGNRLFQQDRGRFVILPLRHPTFKWNWAIRNYHIVDPVPESNVLIARSGQKDDQQVISDYGGTFLEALKTVRMMERHGLRSAIIISSSYHMRRVRVAFNKARGKKQLRFFYHPVANSRPAGRLWWTDSRYLNHILREYKKLVAAYFIYQG